MRCTSMRMVSVDPLKAVGPFTLYRTADFGVFDVVVADERNKLNLLDEQYFVSLMDVCHTLTEELNEEARVAIFRSKEGYSFSGGLNLTMVRKQWERDARASDSALPAMRLQRLHRTIKLFQDGVSCLARCRIPIICAMDKHCIGGATSIATACDIRYATSATSFSVKEAAVGLAADIGVLQRLPSLVGEGRARELLFTARHFGANEAKTLGLVEEVYPDYSSLLDGARRTAKAIACNSALAVQGCKHVMNWQRERHMQESLDYMAAWNAFNLQCEDVVESATAFAEKRPPSFHNYVVNSVTTKPLPPHAPERQ